MKSYLFGALVALTVVFAHPLAANAAQPFDAKSFQKAQAAGKTTLVHVGASWCATCQRQKPVIEQIERELPELLVYEIDFDTGKDVLKRLGVRYQTTLILFRGTTEIARSVGQTDPGDIRALVATGL